FRRYKFYSCQTAARPSRSLTRAMRRAHPTDCTLAGPDPPTRFTSKSCRRCTGDAASWYDEGRPRRVGQLRVFSAEAVPTWTGARPPRHRNVEYGETHDGNTCS